MLEVDRVRIRNRPVADREQRRRAPAEGERAGGVVTLDGVDGEARRRRSTDARQVERSDVVPDQMRRGHRGSLEAEEQLMRIRVKAAADRVRADDVSARRELDERAGVGLPTVCASHEHGDVAVRLLLRFDRPLAGESVVPSHDCPPGRTRRRIRRRRPTCPGGAARRACSPPREFRCPPTGETAAWPGAHQSSPTARSTRRGRPDRRPRRPASRSSTRAGQRQRSASSPTGRHDSRASCRSHRRRTRSELESSRHARSRRQRRATRRSRGSRQSQRARRS